MFKNLKPMLVLFYKNVLLTKYILLVLLFWLIISVPGSYLKKKKKKNTVSYITQKYNEAVAS